MGTRAREPYPRSPQSPLPMERLSCGRSLQRLRPLSPSQRSLRGLLPRSTKSPFPCHRYGGSESVAFPNGHAAWSKADAFLADVPHQDCPDGAWHDGKIEGAGSWNVVTACPTW